MPVEENPSRFRWFKKFIRTDAEQPCRTARMMLSFLRANQWVLFEWKKPSFQEQLFACMKKEVLPKLQDAQPEATVFEALDLEGSLPSQVTDNRGDVPQLADSRFKAQEPWSARKILIDEEGNPIAIGDLQQRRARLTESMDAERAAGFSIREYISKDISKDYTVTIPESEEPILPRDYRVVRIFYGTDRSKTTKEYSNRREPVIRFI